MGWGGGSGNVPSLESGIRQSLVMLLAREKEPGHRFHQTHPKIKLRS